LSALYVKNGAVKLGDFLLFLKGAWSLMRTREGNMTGTNRRCGGFTVVELLLVLTIMGTLAGVLLAAALGRLYG